MPPLADALPLAADPPLVSFSPAENERSQLVPITPVLLSTTGTKNSDLVLTALLDSGGSHTLVHKSVLSTLGLTPTVEPTTTVSTLAGSVRVDTSVLLTDLVFPAIGRHTHAVKAFVLNDDNLPVDLVAGRDLLRLARITLDFANDAFIVDDQAYPFRPPTYWKQF